MSVPAELSEMLAAHDPLAEIRIARVQGSAPREAGAWMVVSSTRRWGTIGGGVLEHMAVETGRRLLAEGRGADQLNLPLGPAIGQCCGGHVRLALRQLDATGRAAIVGRVNAEVATQPTVVVVGAGHVGQALVRALALLPLRALLVDGRADALSLAPDTVPRQLSAMPEAEVRAAPPGAAFVVLTHDHALDFLVTREALAREDAAYVGLIGSARKRAAFARWLRQGDPSPADGWLQRLICPIGTGGPLDKRPSVIAARVAAEVIAHLSAPADIAHPTVQP